MKAQIIEHERCYCTWTAAANGRCSDIAKHLEVGTNGDDRAFAATGRFSHLRGSQRFATDHITNHCELRGCESGCHGSCYRTVDSEGEGGVISLGPVRADSRPGGRAMKDRLLRIPSSPYSMSVKRRITD